MSGAVTRVPLPVMGARVPAWSVRVLLGGVGAAVCVDGLPAGFLLVLGLALLAVAMVVPRFCTAWVLIGVLALTQFAAPGGFEVRTLVLIAGLHALHVLAAYTLVLPIRGWVQVAVFRRPAVRFLAIQVPVQALAVAVLAWVAPAELDLAAAGIVGGVALVAMALLVTVPFLRHRPRTSNLAG